MHLPKHALRQMINQLSAVHLKCKAKATALGAALVQKPGWFGVAADAKDVKQPVEDPYLEFKQLVAASRQVLASAFGSKPVEWVLPVTMDLNCTVVTGLCDRTLDIIISSAPEFAALSGLFDEYRMVRGKLNFSVTQPTSTVVTGTSGIGVSSTACIGWDPSDAVAATNSRDILQLQHHKQLFPRLVPTGTASTHVGEYGNVDNQPYVLHWDYKDCQAVTGNGGVVGPGMWKSTQGNVFNYPDGTLKTYYQTGTTAAVTTFTGCMYWTVQFRTRT